MRILMDIDDTISRVDYTLYDHDDEIDFTQAIPNMKMINKIKELISKGINVTLYTARGMPLTNDAEQARATRIDDLQCWLYKIGLGDIEVIFGKQWCWMEGFYVDDRSIRPSEFLENDLDGIKKILSDEQKKLWGDNE